MNENYCRVPVNDATHKQIEDLINRGITKVVTFIEDNELKLYGKVLSICVINTEVKLCEISSCYHDRERARSSEYVQAVKKANSLFSFTTADLNMEMSPQLVGYIMHEIYVRACKTLHVTPNNPYDFNVSWPFVLISPLI